MRRTIDLTLSLTGLFALISAAGCSSEPEGNGGPITPFGQAGTSAAPGGGGASGATGSTGGNGSVVGGGGEGQGGASFNAGMSGAGNVGAAGAGGTAGLLPSGPVNGYFTSGAWKGYAWTGTETPSVGTTITPTEFTTLPQGEPFCVSGAVAPEPAYQGVSLLGFNINQGDVPEEGQAEPPVLAVTPTGTGVAINFTKTTASILRIQIQGPTGETNENDRWCYEIGETAGPIHALYSDFNTRCWVTPATATPDNPVGVDYAMQPIEAVVFTVPGNNLTPTPYNYCIAGFADGDGPEDAAQFASGGGGLLTGTIDTNFGRQKVVGNDGKSYVIQNNAWNGGAQEGAQQVQFSGNSFTVSRQTNPSFGNIPISFPSIFVGGNGNQGNNGSLATTDDNLPQPINALTSINTTFRHNGGAGPQGEYNVTYDIWFANTPPAGAYDDASAAFLMVWLYKPGGKNPIGLSPAIPNVSIPGSNVMWDIWVGARGENGAEDNLNNDAPVISYVPQATIGNFQADLMNFINDAVARSAAGTLRAPNNGRTFTFGNNLVLTDIFGGAEIWSGAQGLTVSEFTVNVQ